MDGVGGLVLAVGGVFGALLVADSLGVPGMHLVALLIVLGAVLVLGRQHWTNRYLPTPRPGVGPIL